MIVIAIKAVLTVASYWVAFILGWHLGQEQMKIEELRNMLKKIREDDK